MSVLEAVENEKRSRKQLCDLSKPLDHFKLSSLSLNSNLAGKKKSFLKDFLLRINPVLAFHEFFFFF